MKTHSFGPFFLFLTSLLFLPSSASAVVITLGPSTQAVTLTGTGTNASGAGTGRFSWGSCVFDGRNTTCTVSGPYTGLGTGGTYNIVTTYPGNGPSPLGSVATPPGSDLVAFSLTAGSLVFFLTPNNGPEIRFYDLRFSVVYTPGTSSCTGVSVCGVGAVGTSVGGTVTGPLSGSADLTPVIRASQGVITAGAYGGSSSIAPASWIEIYGLNLATVSEQTWTAADFNGPQAPTSVGGTRVTVAGRPAYVWFVTPHQLNVLTPSGIPTGPQPVVVTTAGGASLATTVTVNAVEPGLLAPASFKLAAGQYAVALFPDNTTFVLPPGAIPGVPAARAKPGDTIILFGVGFGPVTPDLAAGLLVQQSNTLSSFQASFAGVAATVKFAGLVSGFTGLYQFNIEVPNVAAGDAVPFTYSLNGKAGTQTLVLPIASR